MQALITTLSRYSFVVSLVGPCWLAGRRGRTVCLLRPSVACVQRALEPISRRSVDFAQVCCRLAVSHRITVLTTLPVSRSLAVSSPCISLFCRLRHEYAVVSVAFCRPRRTSVSSAVCAIVSVRFYSFFRPLYLQRMMELTNNP